MTKIKVKTKKVDNKIIKIRKGDRYKIIKAYTTGREVLDFGCVDHDYKKTEFEKKDFWLHGFICKNAKSCIGIDCNENEIKKLNEHGYNCIAGNAESVNLNRKFDVIVAGEIIEHLYNPGLFLENVKRHLTDNGIFILTTPNPLFLWKFVQILIKDNPIVNEEHTCWFDPKTLSYLMMQHGFVIKEIYWTTLYNYNLLHYTVERIARAIRGYFSSYFLIIATVGY